MELTKETINPIVAMVKAFLPDAKLGSLKQEATEIRVGGGQKIIIEPHKDGFKVSGTFERPDGAFTKSEMSKRFPSATPVSRREVVEAVGAFLPKFLARTKAVSEWNEQVAEAETARAELRERLEAAIEGGELRNTGATFRTSCHYIAANMVVGFRVNIDGGVGLGLTGLTEEQARQVIGVVNMMAKESEEK